MSAGRDIRDWLEPALTLGRQGPAVLRSMLGLIGPKVKVVFSESVATACLAPGEGRDVPYEVRIGTGPFSETLRGPEDLLYLLAHELTHLLREDHCFRAPEAGHEEIVNIAADALNDAWLTGPTFEGFFSPTEALPTLRGWDDPINALLLPQATVAAIVGRPHDDEAILVDGALASRLLFERWMRRPEAAREWSPGLWGRTHHALQLGGREGTMGLEEAYRLTRNVLKQLSSHREIGPLYAAGRMRKPRLGGGQRERTLAGKLNETPHPTETPGELVFLGLDRPSLLLERFVRRFAAMVTSLADDDAMAHAWKSDIGASRIATRTVAEYAARIRATPFARREIDAASGSSAVEIYLDVSFSMNRSLPVMLATIAGRLGDIVASRVRMFSTQVEAVGWHVLRTGHVVTSQGTRFDIVAKDMLARGVKRAVVLSDGKGRALPAALAERLKTSGAKVALVFPRQRQRHPLDIVSGPDWIFELKGEVA